MAIKSGSQTDEARVLIDRFTDLRNEIAESRKKRLAKQMEASFGTQASFLPSYKSGQEHRRKKY